MRTFAQKPEADSPNLSAASAMPDSIHIGQSPKVSSMLHLQRSIGNRAAGKLLQTARVSEENDPLELEADRAADQVMRQHDPAPLGPAEPGRPQAKCACAEHGEEECDTCRQKRLAQRSADGGAPQGGQPQASVSLGGGSPLPDSTRAFMEQGFGTDFSGVRVHTGEDAAASAKDLSARAFTIGTDIAFARNAFQPGDRAGQRLLAHELAHVVQQRKGGLAVQRDEEKGASAGQVNAVRISCEDSHIVFDATGGSYAYEMTACNIPVGSYSVGVSVDEQKASVYFNFGEETKKGEELRFGFKVKAGQINPVTLFKGQKQVAVSVVDHLPAAAQPAAAATTTASLATRVAAFQKLVKQAGKLRLAENSRALDQWRDFLQKQLTPAQVQAQVKTEEVRDLLERASRGAAETALAEQWLQTPGPNRRWVLERQIEGEFRACTGCHATVQAEQMDRALAAQRGQLRTPMEQLPGGPIPGPRPPFAQGEQVAATDQPGVFPQVAQAQDRINAVQPYLRQLGPAGYRVLPPETLGSIASPTALLADINRRIAQRQADYRTFSARIDEPGFDYLHLRPIVRDLLPLAEPDVRKAVQDAIDSAATWETVEKIVVGAAAIGLLILMIFPPTSALGVAGALALGAAVSTHQIYRGLESYEHGRLYSLGRGAHDVLDPAQQEAADSMMAMGVMNMVLGSIGLASSALGTVRLIRAAAPPGGGLGAVEAVEGTTTGGQLCKVTGWGTSNPRVVVTGPNGQVIREGPVSSFGPRAAASGGTRAAANPGSGGGYVYPTKGGAAMVAQPLPEPVPAVAPPQPVPVPAPAPVPGAAGFVAPDVRALLAVTGATSGLGVVASAGAPPQRQPVMPSGLSDADQELWRTCNQQHNKYKATQTEAANYSGSMEPIRIKLMQNQASLQERIDFCALLDERIKIVQRLHSERLKYIKLDCDRFDWFNTGTTKADRLKSHQDELENVSSQLTNFYELRKRLCP